MGKRACQLLTEIHTFVTNVQNEGQKSYFVVVLIMENFMYP